MSECENCGREASQNSMYCYDCHTQEIKNFKKDMESIVSEHKEEVSKLESKIRELEDHIVEIEG